MLVVPPSLALQMPMRFPIFQKCAHKKGLSELTVTHDAEHNVLPI